MCEPQAVEKIVVNCFIGGPARGAGWIVNFVDFMQEVVEQNVPCVQLHENASLCSGQLARCRQK